MKRKFLVVIFAIVATLCMVFGFAACGETENSGTGGGSQTEQPGGSQSGDQGNQGSGGTTKPDEGQGGEEKPDGGQGGNQGGEEKPDKPTEPEKPAEKQIEVKVYIDNALTETLYTSESKGYKIALPAKPEDMTSDPELKNYFDGWYADKGYNEPLTGEETYSAPSAIYGRNITSRMNDFSYTVNNGEATITHFINSTATAVVVPRYINSFPVTTIGQGAFQDKTMLRTVFLCEGLKEIEDIAFCNCNSMQKIVIPSTVNAIRDGAYYDCNSLQEVHITDLSAWCKIEFEEGSSNPLCYAHHLYLNGKEVTKVEFPHDISKIGQYAFYECSLLKEISIPDSVTSIGEQAFFECSGLTGELKIPDSVTSIGELAFGGCSGLTSVTIGNSVTTIERYAFSDTGLTSITIPASVTYIGDGVCNGCNLKEAHFENPNGWIYHNRTYNSRTGKYVVYTSSTSVGIASLDLEAGDWLTRN